MMNHYDDLAQQLARLSESFSELGASVSVAANELRRVGKPAPDNLIKQMISSQQDFAELRNRVLDLAQHFAISPLPSISGLTSLDDLKALLYSIRQAESQRTSFEAIRGQAITILDRVITVVHRTQVEFMPLLQCQAEARALRDALTVTQWPELHPEAQRLADGQHPYASLLTFVESHQALSDDQWDHLKNSIEETFGKPLAIAAVRGRLVLGENAVGQVSEPGDERGVASQSEVAQAPEATAVVKAPVAEAALPPSESGEEKAVVSLGALQPEPTLPVGATTVSAVEHVTRIEAAVIPQPAESASEPTKATGPAASAEAIQAAAPFTRPEPSSTPELEEPTRQPEIVITLEKPLAKEQKAKLPPPIEEPAPPPPRVTEYDIPNELLWYLVENNRLGLAYYLMRVFEQRAGRIESHPPAWLLRAVALGTYVRYAGGEIQRLLAEDFTEFTSDALKTNDPDLSLALKFLAVAAALRPALLSPGTGAPAMLRSLNLKEAGLSQLAEFCQIIADYGDKQQPLDLSALKKARDLAAWQEDVRLLSQETDAWCARAPLMTIVYAPATKVWHKWQEPKGIIQSLLQPVRQNDASQLIAVKRAVIHLSSDNNLKREIDMTDRQILKRRGGEGITARALVKLRTDVREAVAFAQRWIELQESRPGQESARQHIQKQAERLRQEVWSRQKAVMAEIEAFSENHPSKSIAGTLACARRSLENTQMLFDSETPLSVEEPAPRYILGLDWLAIPNVPLNDQLEPESLDLQQLVQGVQQLISDEQFNWQKAFEGRCEARDHQGTLLIVEYLEKYPTKGIDVGQLRDLRDKHLQSCRDALQRDVEETRRQVEGAVAFGLLMEKEHTEYNGELEAVALSSRAILNFAEKHRGLAGVRGQIDKKRVAQVAGAQRRLEGLPGGSANPSYNRILAVLDRGDVLAANEYIDMTLKGLPLPASEARTQAFRNYFPEIFHDIEAYLEKEYPTKIIGAIGNASVGVVDMGRVAGKQATQAAEMVAAWFMLKKSGKVDDPRLRQILTRLGFNPSQILVRQSGRRTWVDLSAEPIRDRNRCPVPFFGSVANGDYRILCVWDRPTEEDLLNDVGETTHGSPVIVFHFGRMTEQRHRDLARLCRERRRTFVVIDDTLMLYVCGERGARLPVMFDCTLPFTFLEPYTTTAGLVPPEMFYGRQRERDSMIDPMGSCFIYGGRQLGKTALLRDVERNFHSPEDGRIAIWLDLKTLGIGYDRPIDDIWNVLATKFKELGVVPGAMPAHIGVEGLLGHVRNWLNTDEQRRILLLLDEADRFLERDGLRPRDDGQPENGEFIRVARLKGLMDQTFRRFKVVFAGLHNVQRTTRLENHPLAHYGEPICIGPLIDGGEWREASALIERPLASLGYRFESPDLVMRILSQTNYYPSLIQLYCNQLLRHITNSQKVVFDGKFSPPYLITSRYVEDAYRSQELRKAIRDRLMWTLDLDPRYRVIASAIALYSTTTDEERAERGFAVSWIREQAMTFWGPGFRDVISEDAFRVLLDEMVGLGVLRVVDTNRYALRSPNVISLIGTQEEIEAELDSASQRDVPQEYEAATFRVAFPTAQGSDYAHRSPFTAQQEAELRGHRNDVAVVLGSAAADLDQAEKYIEAVSGKEFFIPLNNISAMNDFARRLVELDARTKDGTTTMLVSSLCTWNEGWVEAARQKLNKLTSKTSFAKVLFLADPQLTWQIVSPVDLTLINNWSTFTLSPWHDSALRAWLDDCGFTINKVGREDISAVTGNWPFLLESFYQKAKNDSHNWRRYLDEIEQRFKNPDDVRKWARLMGIVEHTPQFVVLSDLAELEGATSSDLAGVIDNVEEETIHQSLRWANLLSLARPVGNGFYQVDRVVARILAAIRSEKRS
ncbi:MAG: hypothetical protein HY268_33510 [Deltaproteobacteria bacterium]|nr:hypothetical protein [Deltaproteobacteria bacterium]